MAITTSPPPGTFKYPRWTDSSQNEINKRIADIEKFVNVITGFSGLPTAPPPLVGGPFLPLAGGTMTGVGDVLMGYGAIVPESGHVSGSTVGMQHQGGAIRQAFGISLNQRYTQTTPQGRTTAVDCTWFLGDTTLTSASANFTIADEGKYIFGPHCYIKRVISPTQVELESGAKRGSTVGFSPGPNAIVIADPLPGSPLNIQINHVLDNTAGTSGITQSTFGLNANQGPRGYLNLEGQTLFTDGGGGGHGGWAGTPIIFQTSNQYVNKSGETLTNIGAGALFNISSQVIADSAPITYNTGALAYRMFTDNFNFVLRGAGAQIIAPNLKYTSFTTEFGMFGTDIFFGEYSNFWAAPPALNANAKLGLAIGLKINTLSTATQNVGIELFDTDVTIGESAVSTTSNTIASTGRFTFAVVPGKNFRGGQTVIAAATTGTNNMRGSVYNYDGAGNLTIDVTSSVGSGTFASWLINATTQVIGIRTKGSFTLGYGLGSIAPQMALWNPVIRWANTGNLLFSSNVFDSQATYQNLGASSGIDLGAVTTFNAQNTYLSEAKLDTSFGAISEFWSRPTLDVLSGGQILGSAHSGFRSSMTVNTGATLRTRYGFRFEDVGGSAPTALLAQVGLSIPYLTGAAANIGIQNGSTTSFPAPAIRTPTAFGTIIADASYLILTGTTAVTLGGGIGPALCVAPGLVDGQRLRMLYLGTGTVTFQDGLGIKLNGANPTLHQNEFLDIMWSTDLVAWVWTSGSASGAGNFLQNITQTRDPTGNQTNPLHVQLNDIVNYSGVRVTSADGNTTNGSPNISSATGAFDANDAGKTISGTGIPGSGFTASTILTVTSSTTATISANATATNTNTVFTIGGDGFTAATPRSYIPFVASTFDGTHGYPAVMQGPGGLVQIDGTLQYNYDAGPFGQSMTIFQTAPTVKNGPRVTSADVHLTNASATVTSATAAFTALDNGAIFTADAAGVVANCTLTYVNATTATMSGNYTGTTSTTATGSIWRKLNLPTASTVNNSPSWIADTQQIGIANQFTISAPGLQAGYSNPAAINGITDDQYFGSVNGGWLNASNTTLVSQANGGYINTAANISTTADFFGTYMVGWTLTSNLSGIPANTTILSVTDARNAVLSANVTATQTTAILTAASGGTDRNSVGFWSLPVWHDHVNMACRYDMYLSEAYMAPGITSGITPYLAKHVGIYIQPHRRAAKGLGIVTNAPIVGYDVDTTYSDAPFKGAGVLGLGAFISLENTWTLDFASSGFGSMLQMSGTVQYRQNPSGFGAGNMVQNLGTFKNARRVTSADGHTTNTSNAITSATALFTQGDVGATISGTGITAGTTIASVTNSTTAGMSAVATATNTNTVFAITANITFSAVSGASMQPTFTADGVPTTFGDNVDYFSRATYNVAHSGTNAGTLSHTSFVSGLTVSTGATAFSRVGLRVNDAAVAGSLSVQYGILIDALAAGSTVNVGIQNNASTYLGGLTVDTSGNVAGTHNLLTTDGVFNPISSGLVSFGAKGSSNTDVLGPAMILARTRITGGVVAAGDMVGSYGFQAASNSGGTTFVNTAQVRSIAEQASSTIHAGGRLEFLTTPLNTTGLVVAAAIDNAGSLHLAPTYTSSLATGSTFAVKADGSVWVAPSAYTSNQPSAAAATISAAGAIAGKSLAVGATGSFTASFTDATNTAANAFATTASMLHRFIEYSATDTWAVAPGAGGMFTGYRNFGIFQNNAANSINLSPIVSFHAAYTKRVDTATGRSFSSDTDFLSGPTYAVANSGTFISGTHASFQAGATLNATGCTLTAHAGLTSGFTATAGTLTTLTHVSINDATGAGTVTTQIGIDIAALAKGGTNIGIRLADAVHIATGTTTGSQFGMATTQKIGFHGATPVVQSATAAAGTAAGAGYVQATAATWVTLMNAMRTCLQDHGLMA